MFQVTTLDLDNVPKNEDGTVDYSQDFFEKPVNLTVSGQLEAEAMACLLYTSDEDVQNLQSQLVELQSARQALDDNLASAKSTCLLYTSRCV